MHTAVDCSVLQCTPGEKGLVYLPFRPAISACPGCAAQVEGGAALAGINDSMQPHSMPQGSYHGRVQLIICQRTCLHWQWCLCHAVKAAVEPDYYVLIHILVQAWVLYRNSFTQRSCMYITWRRKPTNASWHGLQKIGRKTEWVHGPALLRVMLGHHQHKSTSHRSAWRLSNAAPTTPVVLLQ